MWNPKVNNHRRPEGLVKGPLGWWVAPGHHYVVKFSESGEVSEIVGRIGPDSELLRANRSENPNSFRGILKDVNRPELGIIDEGGDT